MRNYKQLSQGQRYQIEILLKAGHTQKEIDQQLNVSSATISREIKRNKGKRGYRRCMAAKARSAGKRIAVLISRIVMIICIR